MTSRRLDPARMPDWPRHMTRELASAYVGVSPAVFDAEVLAGKWPAAQARGAKGGLATWDRVLLDAASDREAGLVVGSPLTLAPALSPEAEAEFRERLRRARTTPRQTKSRPDSVK
jgi:hypothetical protein